jgi:AcrR family transcriptional regulator
MNRTPKTDTARIDLRLKPAEKATIQRLAKQCGLSTTEYLVQRALGYAPREQMSDALYDFYGRLCSVCNLAEEADRTEIEAALPELVNDFRRMALLPKKEDLKQWQPQVSGRSKES